RRNNTWSVPTLVFRAYLGIDTYAPQSVPALLLKALKAFRDGLPYNPAWLHHSASLSLADSTIPRLDIAVQSGLPIAAGTDGLRYQHAGFNLHAELALLVNRGLTPLAALQAATLNPAKLLRATDSLGTVAPGKLADLV